MIPLLGVPVLNREDLAARMVASVDHPVEELLVVVNAPTDKRVIMATTILEAAQPNGNIGRTLFSFPSFNLGCGGSWNHIIRHRPAGPWWLIVNADIEFAPGDLANLDLAMHTNPMVAHLFEFGAFALNCATVDRVGWFDENLHPMYFEDNDYKRRMLLHGVPLMKVAGNTRHDNSSTIGSDQRLAARNQETFGLNAAYYLEKWGGPPGREVFTVPFDGAGERPVSRQRLASQAW